MAIFTLTVTARTAAMGESPDQERQAIAGILHRAAVAVGSGSTPQNGQNLPEPGALNPTNASYAFGPGSLNAPVSPATGTAAGGTAVTILGKGFTGATGVSFGGAAATSVVVTNDGQITATTPAHAAGPVDVQIVKSGTVMQTLPGAFTFT